MLFSITSQPQKAMYSQFCLCPLVGYWSLTVMTGLCLISPAIMSHDFSLPGSSPVRPVAWGVLRQTCIRITVPVICWLCELLSSFTTSTNGDNNTCFQDCCNDEKLHLKCIKQRRDKILTKVFLKSSSTQSETVDWEVLTLTSSNSFYAYSLFQN